MTESLERVVEFMKAGGQGVHYVEENHVPTFKERELRLNLILEELSELADAYGLNRTFINLMQKKEDHLMSEGKSENTNVFNRKEALDANTDLEVVVLGAYIANGFTDIAEEAYNETMDSNMSKFCFSEDEAMKTVAGKEGWSFNKKEIGGRDVYAIHREDGKIMKGINYFKPNYDKLLSSNVQ